MILDFLDPQTPNEFSSDVAIAGSGPAGLSLALRLAQAGRSVVLLEAGGVGYENDSQELYDGELTARDYPLTGSRLRQFGGTSGHWSGQTDSLRPFDLSAKAWMPHDIGWEISYEDLYRYNKQAHEFLDLGSFDRRDIIAETQAAVGVRGGDDFGYDRAWKHRSRDEFKTPIRLAERDFTTVTQNERVSCILHANLIGVERSSNGKHVSAFKIRNIPGKEGTVKARFFVLACGGIENPRLLLNFANQGPLGSSAALTHVGKYFQEHPHCTIGTMAATDTGAAYVQPAQSFTVDKNGVNESMFQPYIAVPIGVQEQERIGAAYYGFYRPTRRQASGLNPPPDSISGKAIWAARSVDEIMYSFIPSALRADDRELIRVFLEIEQAPTPDNRVSLSDEIDKIGLRKLRFNWDISENEVRTALGSAMAFARFLGKKKLGRLSLDDWLTREIDVASKDVGWGTAMHHIGTTRMSSSDKKGVVDTDLKYFGVENFYIAGSSVFPSSGFANPTLTLTALSYRLAEHLLGRFE